MKRAIVLFLLLGSQTASAVTGLASGMVQHIYTYGDGRVLVTGLVFAGATCTHSGGGFWIDGAHPHLERILAVVLTAKANGLTLTVNAKIDNCWYPEIVDASTYVIIGP